MKKTNKNTSMGMALGMCFGISIGTAIGSTFDNMTMGTSLGLCIGMAIGLVLGSQKDKEVNKQVEEEGYSIKDIKKNVVEARVAKVREDGKMDLSIRKKAFMQIDDDATVILRRMEEYGGKLPFTDKADPEVIAKEFGLSKNAFKRAVGRLLKEKRIKIAEKNIVRL